MRIFIMGNSRSGTNLMGRILNKHSRVFTFNELHFFGPVFENNQPLKPEQAVRLFARLIAIQKEGFLRYRSASKYMSEAQNAIAKYTPAPDDELSVYLSFLHYITSQAGKTIPCEQTPVNVFYINEILNNIGDAFIINMVRDPRDVLLSQKRKWKRKFLGASAIPVKESIRAWFNYNPFIISKMWNRAVTLASQANHQNRILTIQFEKLIEHPEQEIKRICRFLNLEFETEMLRVPKAGSSHKPDEKNLTGFDKTTIAQWKKGGLLKTEIAICESINHEWMDKMGYPVSGAKGSFAVKHIFFAAFSLKTIIALFFNLRRMKSLKQTIKRRLLKP